MVLTVATLSRWSVNLLQRHRPGGRPRRERCRVANGGLGAYYSEADTRAPVWLLAGDTTMAADLVGLTDGLRAGGQADPEVVARWLDEGVAPSGECGRARSLRGGAVGGTRTEHQVTKEDHDPASDDMPGEMTSVFRADFLNPEPPLTTSGEGAPPGAALLVVMRGPDAGSRLILDKAVTSAGRHPDSDLFLDDVTVSRRHAEFHMKDDNRVQVVDVGSLNGTYVNRQPVDTATLADGDEVQLGKFRLRFVTGGPHATT